MLQICDDGAIAFPQDIELYLLTNLNRVMFHNTIPIPIPIPVSVAISIPIRIPKSLADMALNTVHLIGENLQHLELEIV